MEQSVGQMYHSGNPIKVFCGTLLFFPARPCVSLYFSVAKFDTGLLAHI